MSERLTGKVVWFNVKTGIGFIEKDDGTGDIFCHYSNIQMDGFKTLAAGQIVEYSVGANDKGPQAVEIKVLKEPK